jgi:uncharacterized protein YggE
MSVRTLLLAVALLVPLGALAQPTPLPETTLHIAESAEVTRVPDEVVAVLRAEARAGSAANAQDAVNRAVTAAVARAQAVQGVRVTTGGYSTWRVDEGRAWQAGQTITLRGGDVRAMTELVGALQGAGLATSQLTRTLTRDTARAAREEASSLALEALKRRAEAVAAQLGLQFVGLREVRIDVPDRGPRPPMPMAAAADSARAATPPVVVAEDILVSASVQAIAVLRPR